MTRHAHADAAWLRNLPRSPQSPDYVRSSSVRRMARWTLALLYLVAGLAHLRAPGGFVAITPQWVPHPEQVIMLTGVAEIAGAIGLLIPSTRKAAAIGLALYALCVWPANINQAINDIPLGGVHFSWWYHAPRLALQPVLIWWALWAGRVIDWPFGKTPN